MQLQSTLTRLTAFAFFLLSFSMLVCAVPAPVPVPGTGALTIRDSSLAARTDYTSQCKDLLAVLKVDVTVKADALVTCSNTPGCDSAPILADIVVLVKVFIGKIKAQVDLGATIDVNVVIELWIEILVLKACVGLTAALCVDLAVVLAAYIRLCLDLCVSIVLSAAILLKIKLAVTAYVSVCLTLGFNLFLSILSLF
ncbi:hypothetical protein FRC10_002613 [Ceratobasidium sp. 414]|nr:hypothetical protein FRC10_002613 [Ceratobasidium sp. 414]